MPNSTTVEEKLVEIDRILKALSQLPTSKDRTVCLGFLGFDENSEALYRLR